MTLWLNNIMKIIKIINLIFLLIFIYSNVNAQISLKTGVNQSTFHIGDFITYSVTITYNKDLKLILPPPGKELGQFDIKDYNITDEETKKNNKIKKIEYTITTYFLGEFEIPSIEIQYKDKKGNTGTIKTEPLLVKVIPIKKLPTDKDDIRDIKKPFYVKTYIWVYILIGLFLIGISIIGYYIYIKKFKKTQEITIKKKEKRLPEGLEALQSIKELQKKGYIKNQQIKQFYFELSEIIREYLHRRYNILTLERTSFEIFRDLKKILNNKELIDSFNILFKESDLVKFAKHKPGANQIKGIIDRCVKLIHNTKRKYQTDEIL